MKYYLSKLVVISALSVIMVSGTVCAVPLSKEDLKLQVLAMKQLKKIDQQASAGNMNAAIALIKLRCPHFSPEQLNYYHQFRSLKKGSVCAVS